MQPQRRSYSKSFKTQVIQECAQPGVSGERALLLATYDRAFRWVLYILAASSALTALLVFALLGRSRAHEKVGAAA